MVCLLLSQITFDSVKVLMNKGYKILFVDVRHPSFFKLFPLVKGAYNLPYDQILAGYEPPRGYDLYITVCTCTRGGIGEKAANILNQKGFKTLWLRRDGSEIED